MLTLYKLLTKRKDKLYEKYYFGYQTSPYQKLNVHIKMAKALPGSSLTGASGRIGNLVTYNLKGVQV